MGHRLSKIYTRTGDAGTTGLADGSRVNKDSARIHAIGDLDELNSQIGVILTHTIGRSVRETLIDVQHALFDLGAECAVPGMTTLTATNVVALESALDTLNADLPPLKEFILPGGGAAATAVHVARTVCRRAERSLVTLAGDDIVNDQSQRYLNRLSDYLFVLARSLARSNDGEVYWHNKHRMNR